MMDCIRAFKIGQRQILEFKKAFLEIELNPQGECTLRTLINKLEEMEFKFS